MRFTIEAEIHCSGPDCDKSFSSKATLIQCHIGHLHVQEIEPIPEGWIFGASENPNVEEVAVTCSERCMSLLEVWENAEPTKRQKLV